MAGTTVVLRVGQVTRTICPDAVIIGSPVYVTVGRGGKPSSLTGQFKFGVFPEFK
jgi:hypothetical protein